MLELYENDLKTFQGHSSKGNQLKWKKGDIWYKADYTGYEGLSEYVIANLLALSDLNKDEYVLYDTKQIKYKHTTFNCATSYDFLPEGNQLITLSRLYKTKLNRSFTEDIWRISDMTDRLDFLVEQVIRMTNLSDFGIYLNKMLTVDALFLNEDRHLHNIAVLMKPDNSFGYCPLFDHGAGLLADTTMDYTLGINIFELIGEVKAKTVCQSFDEALEASERLFGQNIHFHFTKGDVSTILDKDTIYANNVKSRVKDVLFEQMRRYQYLFYNRD